LDARSEKRTLADFENGSDHSKAVGINKSSNTNTVANFELSHPKIILCMHSQDKELFLGRIVDVMMQLLHLGILFAQICRQQVTQR
jgi:hypothetical protein